MQPEVQKIVDAAMERVLECRGMRIHYEGQTELAKNTPGTPQKVIDGLARDRDDYTKRYAGMRTLLAHVLDAAGYKVSEPFPDGSGSLPSAILAEDELNKWAKARKKVSA